jgi:hypothetical protein
MASYGKSYPNKAHDPRRKVGRPFNEVPEERMQEPTLTREQELAYMNQAAFEAMMKEAPGAGPVSQMGDAMLDRDNK